MSERAIVLRDAENEERVNGLHFRDAKRSRRLGCKKSAQRCGLLRLLPCNNDSTRDGTFVRWGTRCVRPRSALAKTPCADGAVWSFFLCPRSCKHGADIRKTPTLLRSEAFLLVGAGGRTRTDTDFTPQDFESSASASFTTPAH